MRRALYLIAIGYLALCGIVVVRAYRLGLVPTQPVHTGAVFFDPAAGWWSQMKASCNPVEVELAQRRQPAPASLAGQGYGAACWALAGKLDSARAVIDRLPSGDRYWAAGMVFDVAHPVADAGDDLAAGPIMELVIHYWPNHYMALYHAGMAEWTTGQHQLARKNLRAFLANYHEKDGWTRNARAALAHMEVPQ